MLGPGLGASRAALATTTFIGCAKPGPLYTCYTVRFGAVLELSGRSSVLREGRAIVAQGEALTLAC